MKAALAIGAVYGLLARRACPCRFLLEGCLAAQSPSSARRLKSQIESACMTSVVAARIGELIRQMVLDLGVTHRAAPRHMNSQRFLRRSIPCVCRTTAFIVCRRRWIVSAIRSGSSAEVLVAAPNERVVHQRYWTCGAAWQAATIESAPRRSTMQENFMLTLELRSSAGSRSKRPKPV